MSLDLNQTKFRVGPTAFTVWFVPDAGDDVPQRHSTRGGVRASRVL